MASLQTRFGAELREIENERLYCVCRFCSYCYQKGEDFSGCDNCFSLVTRKDRVRGCEDCHESKK